MNQAGCRPLTDSEVTTLLSGFQGRYALRDQALVVLGVHTGYRVGELLSLRIADVWSGTEVRSSVTVARRWMKGGKRGRTVPLHERAKTALQAWILASGMDTDSFWDWPLFPCQHKCHPISRQHARRILVLAAEAAGVDSDRLATHTLRKTFARRLWDSPTVGKDPARMARLLGHTNWSNTLRYLEFTDLDAAVLA